MKVALLTPSLPPERPRSATVVPDLAAGLAELGHEPIVITAPRYRPPEGRFRRRGYDDYLTHLPFSYLSLARSDAEIAHADYHVDALAAARWAERRGRPSVLTYMGVPDHAGLTERRFRLELVQCAVSRCTVVVAPSERVRDEFRRSLGVEARVIEPGADATDRYVELYEELLR